MKKKEILEHLESLAQSLGLSVRYEELGTHSGGICKLFGKNFLFINKSLNIDAKIEFFAQELKKFDLSGIFILPEIRKILQIEEENIER